MDRVAVDTIKGYFYQFDYTIACLLNLDNSEEAITVEGIEDVDIKTAVDKTAVQCKYYAKTEYNHSVIKEPIMHMLDHFKEVKDGRKPKVNYLLRGHYKSGQDKLNLPIDLDFLKSNFLTYTKTKTKDGTTFKNTYHRYAELDLTDEDLIEFLSLLKIDTKAEEFETQYGKIIEQLKLAYNCSDITAEYLYYNNALKLIKDLSISEKEKDRTITKKDFLSKIDTGTILFGEWFLKRRGKKEYYKQIRSEFFAELNINPFERLFLIEITQVFSRSDLKELLFLLSRKWSKLSKREPSPFCPYVYIHGIERSDLVQLKRDLSKEGFRFTDGFDFQGADFDVNSIKQTANIGNGIKLKIINTIEQLNQTIDSIVKTREIYQFYLEEPFYRADGFSAKHLKVQVEHFNDIKQII